MFKKILLMLLVGLLLNLMVAPPVWANNDLEKDAKSAEKVKAGIAKLGVGKDSKVEVKLKDGTKLKGYVSEIGDSGFIVTDEAGKSTVVPYPRVKQVKGSSKRGWIAFGIGVGFLIVIAIIAAAKSK